MCVYVCVKSLDPARGRIPQHCISEEKQQEDTQITTEIKSYL